VGAELFHADGRTDRQDENKSFFFRNFAKAPKTDRHKLPYFLIILNKKFIRQKCTSLSTFHTMSICRNVAHTP